MDAWGRRLRLPAFASALVVVAGLVVWVSMRDTPQPARAAATTTTSTSTTTTTAAALPPIDVDPGRTTVATAAVGTVVVHAQPPAGAVLDPRASAAGATLANLVPATSPGRPDAEPIPTIDDPVIGRRATSTGWEFDNPTPWGNPLAFIVTENHGEWLRVEMPVRPNGLEGWIRASEVTQSEIDTRVEIDLGDHQLRAWAGDTLLVETKVVLGKPATPTPEGRLYLTDFEEKYAGSTYGPWILPLSGYSQTLDEFSGGKPVIALHGTNRPELVGTNSSNGCVRLPNEAIQLLRDRLPIGTPVDIRA